MPGTDDATCGSGEGHQTDGLQEGLDVRSKEVSPADGEKTANKDGSNSEEDSDSDTQSGSEDDSDSDGEIGNEEAITTSFPLDSRIYTLIAGQSRKHIHVHADFLSKSNHFRVMMQGEWQEKEEGQIVLSDWDHVTVFKFAEWLYTNNYALPSVTEAARNFESVYSKEHYRWQKEYIKIHDRMKASLKDAFKDSYPLYGIELHKPETAYFRDWLRHAFDEGALTKFPTKFKHVLLFQARLYVFADYALANDLRILVFYRIAMMLFTAHQFYKLDYWHPEIVCVTRHVYANTCKSSGENDPLRYILSHFLALKFQENHADGLITEGGEIAGDIAKHMRAEISNLNQKNNLPRSGEPPAKRARVSS